MVIKSLENEKIKYYKKLKEKKYRDQYKEFLVEGYRLIREAYMGNLLKEVLILEGEKIEFDIPTIEVTYEILRKITQVETPQKMIGLCKMKEDTTIGNRILIFDGLQNPLNVGTIIRSAVAFDIDTIIMGKDTVDLYNPKVIRGTGGMLFRVSIVFFDIHELIPILKNLAIPVFATSVENGYHVKTLTKEEKSRFALIVGNEGNGVKKEFLEASDKNIYIPMNEKVESLNVAVATSILLYEMRC